MLKAREDGWGQAGRGGIRHSLRGLQLFDRRVPLEMDTLLFSLTLIGLGYVTQRALKLPLQSFSRSPMSGVCPLSYDFSRLEMISPAFITFDLRGKQQWQKVTL